MCEKIMNIQRPTESVVYVIPGSNAAPVQMLGHNPKRKSFIIGSLLAQALFLNPYPDETRGAGISWNQNAGPIKFSDQEIGAAVAKEWYVKGVTAGSTMFVIETFYTD